VIVTFSPPTVQEQRSEAIGRTQLVPRPRDQLTALQIAAAILYLINDQRVPRERLEYALREVGRLENLSKIELAATGSNSPNVPSLMPGEPVPSLVAVEHVPSLASAQPVPSLATVEPVPSLAPAEPEASGPSRSNTPLSREWVVPPKSKSGFRERFRDTLRQGRALAAEQQDAPAPAGLSPSADSGPPPGQRDVGGLTLSREWVVPHDRRRAVLRRGLVTQRQARAVIAAQDAMSTGTRTPSNEEAGPSQAPSNTVPTVIPPTASNRAAGQPLGDLLHRAHALNPEQQDALSMEVVRSTWVRILSNQESRPSTLEDDEEEPLQDIVSITSEDIRSTWARMFSTEASGPTALADDDEARRQARLRITSDDIMSTMAGMLAGEESGPTTQDTAGEGQERGD